MTIEKEIIYTSYTPSDLKDHDAIACVIKNNQEEILLFFHKKFQRYTFPMGKVEENDSIENTIIREMKEELNIDIIDFEIAPNYQSYKYNRDGKIIQANIYISEILKYSGDIINIEPEKHSSFIWVSIDDLMKIHDDDITDAVRVFKKNLDKK